MREHGYTYEKAFTHLLTVRPIVQPNIFFVYQLKSYEKTALAYYESKSSKEICKKEEFERYMFICDKCKTLLFKSENLAKHSNGKITCSSCFIEKLPWMARNLHGNEGIIKCPNIKVTYMQA